jgi:hypothetical protein
MRSAKGTRRIVVNNVEYRWRATGDDFYIQIGIWPSNNIGPYISGNLGYHESWIEFGDGSRRSVGDQIVVTNRIIQRIIEQAITQHGYDPNAKGTELNLGALNGVIRWDDAVRATDDPNNPT